MAPSHRSQKPIEAEKGKEPKSSLETLGRKRICWLFDLLCDFQDCGRIKFYYFKTLFVVIYYKSHRRLIKISLWWSELLCNYYLKMWKWFWIWAIDSDQINFELYAKKKKKSRFFLKRLLVEERVLILCKWGLRRKWGTQ